MSVDSQQVQQINELLGGMGDADTDEKRDQNTNGPETAADIIGDIAGDSPEHEPADAGTVESDAEGDTPGEPTGDDEPQAKITPTEIAELMGVDAKDVYTELEIPLPNGESFTLSEAKDRYVELLELDKNKEAVEEEKSELGRKEIALIAEMQQMINVMPPEMREQAVKLAGQRHHSYIEQQEQMVLDAIPEWRDRDVLAKDRDAIIALGREYGYTPEEVTGTHDARALKMIHDMARMKARLANADANSKKQTKAAPGAPGKAKKKSGGKLAQAIAAAKQSADTRLQEQAVSQLIRNQ